MTEFEQDVDQRLAALDEKETELTQACRYQSADRVAREIRRVAQAEERLIPYIYATFTVMNQGTDLLNPQAARDASLEMISLLESEDRARAIQPQLPEAEYEDAVAWLSSCAYDNLAKATATIHGYNSEGIHACIADGIQVCRQTGKMQCITCFREYATDVYAAADDLDMAMHYARMGIAHDRPGPHDRRWQGARDLARLLLLKGQIEAAADAIGQAWELTETWHNVRFARLLTRLAMAEIAHLLGTPTRWESQLQEDNPLDQPPPDEEFLSYALRRDQVQAVIACCAGEFSKAIELLSGWDRQLSRDQCLSDWFENRLRLVAAHRLAGNEREWQRLGEPLAAKAKAARDWLTLRRWERLRDTAAEVAPVPVVAPLTSGPFAPGKSATDGDSSSDPQAAAPPTTEAAEGDASSPARHQPPGFVQEWWSRLEALATASPEEQTSDSADAVLADILARDPHADRSVDEARWLLHTVRFTIGDGARGREVWDWAEKLATRFPADAVLISLQATLGAALRFGHNSDLEDLIDEERLEAMFRESLDLDSDGVKNFARAGDYFLFMENLGEAERCYARAFRLDRSNAEVAKELANIYRRTERERDALTVLDMCLREGGEDPDLAWQAALTAQHIGQHEATLTYLDAYEKRMPDQPWVNYYRAAALLELDRPSEALEATAAEAAHFDEPPLHVKVHRASAAAGLGERDTFHARLTEVLDVRLADVDYLTQTGVCRLFQTLWNASGDFLDDESLRKPLEDRLVASGLAPNEMFDRARADSEPQEDVGFYECLLRQPLDERWNSWHGRMAEEDDWAAYHVTYGVLAADEDEAADAALAWQKRAYPLPAVVLEVTCEEDGYEERVGVVWQGFREKQ